MAVFFFLTSRVKDTRPVMAQLLRDPLARVRSSELGPRRNVGYMSYVSSAREDFRLQDGENVTREFPLELLTRAQGSRR